MENKLPLHLCHVMKSSLIINRLHMFIHGIALIIFINYRVSTIYQTFNTKGLPSSFPFILIFVSELILSFLWVLNQAFRWRPVTRTVFPERLPQDDKLPSIDIFICTTDPSKEPSIGVMNTVISAMSLDYPPDKLNVYLSDDGGSPLTLFAMKEAWRFARFWLPFCKKYGVKTRCPEAYFSGSEEYNGSLDRSEFVLNEGEVKKQYEAFKDRVQNFQEKQGTRTSKDHPPIVGVIKVGDVDDLSTLGKRNMPLLVYVSREKRPSHSHHFKAGALNVLLRVSGMMSNAPYILILDCDMYCNDPSSARQAMRFHVDPDIASKLAFVQFPQRFHNISKIDIYDSELRSYFMLWNGFDGLQGPVVSGSNLYIKREALYGGPNGKKGMDLHQLEKSFGPSHEFLASIYQKNKENAHDISSALLKETELLASCAYEKQSKWGEEVGFRYFSVVEDNFTGFMLSCSGWISVYLNPTRPAFLGSATTSLSDVLVQNTRWCVGLGQISLSKYSGLLFGLPRMPILQSMCYGELHYRPFCFLPLWCLAILPQVCLVRGISLYPPASSPSGMVFGFLFLSSILKHMQEVLFDGYSIQTWLIDQRIWMIKSVTSFTYGILNAILEKLGAREATFLPTNKITDESQEKRYQMGIFDFQASIMFIAPICTLVILNAAVLIIGGSNMVNETNYDQMFFQVFIAIFILMVQYPMIEGMILRKDNGRVAPSAAIFSAALALVVLLVGYYVLLLF